MDFGNNFRLCDAQKIIVALEIIGEHVVRESSVTATKVVLRELPALNHGAHGTIKDHDPLLEDFGDLFFDVCAGSVVLCCVCHWSDWG